MTNTKTVTVRIDTKASEKEIFIKLKEFLTDNFQEYSLEVSGYQETLRHKINRANQERPRS